MNLRKLGSDIGCIQIELSRGFEPANHLSRGCGPQTKCACGPRETTATKRDDDGDDDDDADDDDDGSDGTSVRGSGPRLAFAAGRSLLLDIYAGRSLAFAAGRSLASAHAGRSLATDAIYL